MKFKSKCKKTYYNTQNFTTVFKKDEWYDILCDDNYEKFFIIIGTNVNTYPFEDTLNIPFPKNSFEEFFMTVDEYREMEINKILL